MKRPKVSITEFLFKELLDFYFSRLRRLDNYCPEWLKGLEIDRYYPDIKVGVEFQGIQHYRPTKEYQGSRKQFFGQLSRDSIKIRLAEKQGVKIFPIGLYDISPERFKYHMKQIAKTGISVAKANKDMKTIQYLKAIRWDKDPDPVIFKRLEGIRRSPKWKVRSPPKKSWLKRLFGF